MDSGRQARPCSVESDGILEEGRLHLGASDKYKLTITPLLLSYLIEESQRFGGTVLDQFWDQVGNCLRKLKLAPHLVSLDQTLLDGIDRENIDFKPVFQMAAELLTHLGIAFMNPGDRKSDSGTPYSASDVAGMETNELLRFAAEEGFTQRQEQAPKSLSLESILTSSPPIPTFMQL